MDDQQINRANLLGQVQLWLRELDGFCSNPTPGGLDRAKFVSKQITALWAQIEETYQVEDAANG